MVDLSHWDISLDFTPAQAANLIVGQEPFGPEAERSIQKPSGLVWYKALPVYERMEQSYEATRVFRHEQLRPPPEWSRPKVPPRFADSMFESVEIKQRWDELDIDLDHVFISWLSDDNYSGFDLQRFSRQEIVRWLRAIGEPSAYSFDRIGVSRTANEIDQWPWGNHSTKALLALKAAAIRYWKNYDPSDQSTAPTNDTVSDWLVDEQGLSRTQAEAIASILRADDLKPGPR